MTEPRMQHTAHELQEIAELLTFLNQFVEKEDRSRELFLEGAITVYWTDIVQGTVSFDGDVWVYFPTAKGEKPEKGAEGGEKR